MEKKQREVKAPKPVDPILDKTVLVAHANHQISLPFLIGMRELVKIYKPEFKEVVKKYIDHTEVAFMQNPNVATALVNDLKGGLPFYEASPADKQTIVDFFNLCEEQLFNALANNVEAKHPDVGEHYNIGDLVKQLTKGNQRLIVGVFVRDTDKHKNVVSYQYMDGDNKQGTCDHVSMVSWANK